jgi:hypothetical protein
MGNESSDYRHIRKRGQKEKTITVMKTIKEVATKAAKEMVFESKEKLKMIEVTIAPKKNPESNTYSIRIPKKFLEEVYSMGLQDGFRMYIDEGRVL